MSETRTAAQIQAEIDALRAEQSALWETERAARREAEAKAAAERNAEAFASIAAEVGGDAEKVSAFLVKVSDQSGFGLDYLVSVITGQPNTSNRWLA